MTMNLLGFPIVEALYEIIDNFQQVKNKMVGDVYEIYEHFIQNFIQIFE